MNARCAVLSPPYVNRCCLEIDLIDLEIDQLLDPQSMAVSHEHQQPITVGVAALASCGEQLVDLGFGQVFPTAVGRVLGSP
jgi:hypothetical protein